MVARRAHNPKVNGSNPFPATNKNETSKLNDQITIIKSYEEASKYKSI